MEGVPRVARDEDETRSPRTSVSHSSTAHSTEQAASTQPQPSTVLTRRLILVFAVACGAVAANNYYAQPLLNQIAIEFKTTPAAAGMIVTLAQLGFALGLLFLLPIGDFLDRRRLVVLVLCGTALTLAATAVAPSLAVLALCSLLAGLTSVVAQMLVPFAASLATDAERGRVVGTVMSGLLLGILLARTVAGLVSQVAGWRSVYVLGAVLMLAVIAMLWRTLPRTTQPTRPLTRRVYVDLLVSVAKLAREEPILRLRAAYGGLSFAAFSVLWTTIAFLLARPPYGFNQAAIGLFGLLGVAGALCASVAGRLADRGWSLYSTGGFLFIMMASYGLIALGGHLLLALIAGVLLLDLGVQGAHITNQSEIYRLRPDARSRITTVYMTAYFGGGALGSATSAVVYGTAGWSGVALLGAGFGALALLIWAGECVLRVRRAQAQRATGGYASPAPR